MTNEEAIATLKYQHDYGKMEQEVHDALDMAIKALQQSEPCEDTISRQATINVITKRLYETAFNNIGIKQDIDETLVDVAENRLENWFNELPPIQPEQRWIPVSERLPEEGKVVLTQAKFKDDVKMAVSSRIDYNYWTTWGTRDINIIAWMPLPEPYKGEQK